MGKTVTLKQARPGRTRVQVGEQQFVLGVPVRDVSDTVLEQLKAVPGVHVSVHAPKSDKPKSEKPAKSDKAGGQTP